MAVQAWAGCSATLGAVLLATAATLLESKTAARVLTKAVPVRTKAEQPEAAKMMRPTLWMGD